MKSKDLFEQGSQPQRDREQPLAARMRPRTLDEFVGQDHILGQGRLLRRAIQADQLSSIIFYGPPGTGKTTLARVIANTTKSNFITINAVLAGVKEIRTSTDEAQERYNFYGQRTILFVDEVHRWNKAQQDALLPWVENGTIILIGATTENPYFEVNRALVSRSRIFQLKPLTEEDLYTIARNTLKDEERGYGKLKVKIDKEALVHLVDVSNGDARTLLNALELAVETTPDHFPPSGDEAIHVTLTVAEESIQRRAVLYDKEGDYHFDTISAFIKSLRGSDPDAALYWLAKMVYAGEDSRFIFRRMIILASEDVGLADPDALPVVEAAASAFDRVGLPEGRFHLAQAALYLATCPKSNSTMAFFDALNTVENERNGEVPDHLKDSSRDKEGFGHGKGYLYPHAYRDHWVAQQYLPSRLQGKIFYEPGTHGFEAGIREQVVKRREAQLAAMLEAENRIFEVLSSNGSSKAKDLWLERTMSSTGEQLADIRDRVLNAITPDQHKIILDLNAGSGLFIWELIRRVNPVKGYVWGLTRTQDEAKVLSRHAQGLGETDRPVILTGEIMKLPLFIEQRSGKSFRFDAAVGRDAFGRERDKRKSMSTVAELLKPGGVLSLAETIPALGSRLSECVRTDALDEDIIRRLKQAEQAIYRNPQDLKINWDQEDLLSACRDAGLKVLKSGLKRFSVKRKVHLEDLNSWFSMDRRSGRSDRLNYAQHLLKHLSSDEIRRFSDICRKQLADRSIDWHQAVFFLLAEK